MSTAIKSWPLGPLVEHFDITLPDGRRWQGSVYRHHGPNPRWSGRRIVVRETPGGPVLFDTDEQYDLSNAINALDNWLAAQIGQPTPA